MSSERWEILWRRLQNYHHRALILILKCASQVYPEQSAVIEMDEPLGEVANAVRDREIAVRRKLGTTIDQDEINDIAMQSCIKIALQKLQEVLGDLPLSGPDGIKQLLVKQRHLHKKGIMFTIFIFAIVIADVLGIEIVWSSDCECLEPTTHSRLFTHVSFS